MSELVRARTIEDAVRWLARGAADGTRVTLLAGGTDLLVEQHLGGHGEEAPGVLVDVSGVGELARVERFHAKDGREWARLGGGVTYRALRTDPLLVARAPILGAMAADVGAVQIQARGTLGGNLATGSPAADGVPALAALGAVLTLASEAGAREVPLEGYYTGYKRSVRRPDELIASVAFPLPAAGARWYWRKVGTRRAQSIAKVALASVVELGEDGAIAVARLAMASVAPTVALLPRVRAELAGRRPEDVDQGRVVSALRADIAPIDDVRSTRAYRQHVAERLVLRMLEGIEG